MQFITIDADYLKPISYVLSFAVSIYAFWRIAKKEGFVNTQIFDFYFTVALCFAVLSYKFGFEVGSAASLLLIVFIIKVRKWSLRKLGAVMSIPITAGLAFAAIATKNLILFGLVTAVLALLVYLRRDKVFEKYLFYLTLLLLSPIAIIFFAGGNDIKIAYYLLIILVSIANIAVEIKRNNSAKRTVMDTFSKIKSDLLKRQSSLEKQKNLLESEDSYKVAGRADENAEIIDDAQEDVSHTITIQSLSKLRLAINQIQKALNRIRKGKYGVCEKCNAKIDPARLKAYPETTLCLKCSQSEK